MGTLSLSGASTSYDMIRLSVRLSKFRFTHVIGFLKQIPPIPARKYTIAGGDSVGQVDETKYLAAHRLEFSPTDRLSIGIYESIIFGGRFEPAYLNPIMFFKSAEHYLGDHDNAALGFDARLRAWNGFALYGEIFIDDISTTKLGTGWYANKFGFQCGSYMVNPLGVRNTDLRIQYTRIEPYVYSHRIPINVYQHYGTSLGHHIGPNADEAVLTLNVRPSRRLTGTCIFRFRRHGTNPPGKNVGGDINVPFRKDDSEKVHFLDGDVEKRFLLDLSVRYEFFRNAFLAVGGFYGRYSGAQNLPDGENKMLHFSIGLNE